MRVGLENQSRASCVRGFIYSSVPSIPFALIVAPARSLVPSLYAHVWRAPNPAYTSETTATTRYSRGYDRTALTVRRRKRRRGERSGEDSRRPRWNLCSVFELLNGIGDIAIWIFE